ncbi:hypothetical protein SISSUDRAFT_566286 [Sistotremastrum suecicum HHB10207 ss-3]|uniref:Uncharacterized protein n=1 Tax=Sistotremastrum suecicum HHB10207 ss-3 TaxID=1314776 RepID=A0A166EUQ8_9AGAM|nr:hypothetical protein SISSUDRAFT_566286 [Sistotremastrum suecicum HHB10207 ss-3]
MVPTRHCVPRPPSLKKRGSGTWASNPATQCLLSRCVAYFLSTFFSENYISPPSGPKNFSLHTHLYALEHGGAYNHDAKRRDLKGIHSVSQLVTIDHGVSMSPTFMFRLGKMATPWSS